MPEKIAQFGLRNSLTGILSLPDATLAKAGVVFLNSGILHSVGASRLHVSVARDLAAKGIASLRFDQSTIGDSGPRFSGGGYLEAAISETIEAIELLVARSNVEKVILFGLCSGSDVAFETAIRDTRVAGLVQLDPYAYRTPRYYWTYYAPRALKLSPWSSFFRRALGIKQKTAGGGEPDSGWFDRPEYVRVFPPRKEIEEKYQKLVERGVQFLCVFSGGQVYAYNYRGQLADSLANCDFRNSLTECFYPASSHIFTDVEDQNNLRALVCNWIVNGNAAGEGATSTHEQHAPG